MENGILIALISKMVAQQIAELPTPVAHRGPRGPGGPSGKDGKDFIFADHEEKIRQWCRDFSLKFEDLSSEELESLRGPRGRDGVDGKGFDFDAHAADIDTLVRRALSDISDSLKLKFADLSADEIQALRGPRGEDGRNFIFEENKDAIEAIILSCVNSARDELRLKFSDLDSDEIEQLRGPRGRDGRDGTNGRGFVFDEHRDFFLSLKPKFSDFTAEERETLRLQFSNLTPEEKSELKLRFEDLTEDDKALIRGARGPKGQKGRTGNDGVAGRTGPQGPRGRPGPVGQRGLSGIQGLPGINGRDGVDGQDAPFVTDIELEEFPVRNEIAFTFRFSDGSEITTETVKLPEHTNIYVEGGTSGGGGGSGGGIVPIQQDGVEIVAEPTAINFTGNVSVTQVGDVAEVEILGGGGGGTGAGPGWTSYTEIESVLENNQPSLVNLPGMVVPGGKSFIWHYYIERITDGVGATELYQTGVALITKTGSSYRFTPFGDDTDAGVVFDINSAGQIKYTSTDITGDEVSSKVNGRFEVLSGDVTGLENEETCPLDNDQATPTDITGMIVGVEKSALVHFFIERETTGVGAAEFYHTGFWMVTKLGATYRLTPLSDDGDAGVTLDIDTTGQFNYTSTDETGTPSVFKINWRFMKLVG